MKMGIFVYESRDKPSGEIKPGDYIVFKLIFFATKDITKKY